MGINGNQIKILAEAKQEGFQKGKMETAKRMINSGKMSCEEISLLCGLDTKEIEELRKQIEQ